MGEEEINTDTVLRRLGEDFAHRIALFRQGIAVQPRQEEGAEHVSPLLLKY